jgi:hypothetical protein
MVITYTTFTALVVVFTSVSEMDAPLPLPAALLIPATAARVQVNVAPVVAVVAV